MKHFGVSRRTICLASWIIAVNGFSQTALAQTSDKTIEIVVGFSAGGAGDIATRLIATQMAKALGQPVVVQNKPGASGAIGIAAVSAAPGDGHTLMFGSSTTMGVLSSVKPQIGAQTSRLVPVAQIAEAPLVLVARQGLPVKSMADLVTLAKRSSKPLTYGSSGTGGLTHITGEAFQSASGAKLLHIPYKGDSQIAAALLANDVDIAWITVASVLPLAKEGKLIPIAVTGAQALDELPGVPTFTDVGFQSVSFSSTYGLLASPNTPRAVAEKLSAAVKAGVESAEYRAAMKRLFLTPVYADSAAYAAKVKKELQDYSAVIGKLDRSTFAE